MGKLTNKVAVITGGNSGIGYETAKEFIAQGATVVITGRNKEAVEKASKELKASAIVADQSKLSDIDNLVSQVKATHGKVDILFINAGIGTFIPIELVDEAFFDNIMDTNFKGAYFTLNKFIPILNEGASVIFTSSVTATSGSPNLSVYAASKAAINTLTKVAASELAPKKIRVNSISPGPVDTPIFDKFGLDEAATAGMLAAMANRIPLKRLGMSQEVGKLVSFLASDDAAFISGSDYLIDGGVNVITY